ncbi:hypothetical protein HMPREF1318_2452 [Actinomyces massiliensis F0489]|uniref:Uncharacterized protein n=1 Tax=Actinomyces massiliensis F0489 TaxID=1125718 RepID=J0NDC1_9ACTO|nr:hypothetical protein HMPREF1318_2452 [Actinomyces massiliensis F0489]
MVTEISWARRHALAAFNTDRSRAGVQPISTRSATDLDAECDRSRAGIRPISTRVTTDLGE